jgi:putative lipoprotein
MAWFGTTRARLGVAALAFDDPPADAPLDGVDYRVIAKTFASIAPWPETSPGGRGLPDPATSIAHRAHTTGTEKVFRVAFTVAWLALAPSPARAASPDDDPWLGEDKAKHFAVSAVVAGGGYGLSAALVDARGHALILGGAFAFGVGVAKEVADLAGLGDPSWKDLTWDALGTASGLAIAWGVDLIVRGVGPAHPLLVAPQVTREGAVLGVAVRF